MFCANQLMDPDPQPVVFVVQHVHIIYIVYLLAELNNICKQYIAQARPGKSYMF